MVCQANIVGIISAKVGIDNALMSHVLILNKDNWTLKTKKYTNNIKFLIKAATVCCWDNFSLHSFALICTVFNNGHTRYNVMFLKRQNEASWLACQLKYLSRPHAS